MNHNGRWQIFFFSIFSVSLFLVLYNLYRGPQKVFKDQTRVGGIDLSGKSEVEGKKTLDTLINKPFYLNLENSSRSITLKDIGVGYDESKIEKHITTCKVVFPIKLCNPISIKEDELSSLITIDNNKLDEYIENLNKEFESFTKNSIVSFEDYTFAAVTENTKVSVDKDDFVYGTILDQVSKDNIRISLKTVTQDANTSQKERTQQLMRLVSKPMLIKYGRTPIYIQTQTLETFMGLKEDEAQFTKVQLYDIPIYDYLTKLKSDYYKEDVVLLENDAVEKVKQALLYRAANNDVNNAVVLPLAGKSKTNGELHDIYLEVIKSQQRLYRFEKGKLVKTYVVSTGLTWETPPGEYKVLGKEKMAISYFGNWYMPDYLPIGTLNGGFRFGFHAIPYHIDAGGNIYSRDPNTMGSPATGGCIQLKPEEATELYDWAKIGTPVYIYE